MVAAQAAQVVELSPVQPRMQMAHVLSDYWSKRSLAGTD